MKKIYLLLTWLFSCVTSNAQQRDSYVIKDVLVKTDLAGYLFSAKNLKFNDEKEIILHQTDFKKVAEKIANFGSSKDENWVFFKVKNGNLKNQKFVLLLDQVFLKKPIFIFLSKILWCINIV